MNDSYRHINQDVKNILEKHKNREPAFDGTVLEGRERKYTILSEKDREKYLTVAENGVLDEALFYYLGKIEEGRARDGKEPFNSYIVINVDEPYVGEVIEIMKRNGHWEDGK